MIFIFDWSMTLTDTIRREHVLEAVMTEQIMTATRLSLIVDQDVVDMSTAAYIGHTVSLAANRITLYKIIRHTITGHDLRIEGIESAYDDLIADGYVTDLRPQGRSVIETAAQILDGSGWSLGTVATGRTVTGNFYYISRLDALYKMAELARVEFRPRVEFVGKRITGRYIDITDRIGEDRGKRYVHGHGLLEVVRETDASGIYTALVGRGKGETIYGDDGEATGGFGRAVTFASVEWRTADGHPVDKPYGREWVEIPEYTQAFGFPDGRPRIGIIDLGDIEDPAQLLRETYEQLQRLGRPQVLYRASVLDQGDTGLGDTVAIIRDDYGIRYKVRIVKKTTDLLTPERVTIELGDRQESTMAGRLSALKEDLDRQREDTVTNLERVRAAIANATELYWGEDGYNYDLETGNSYGLPAGAYSFDRPIDQDPTKMIYFGAGKLAVANSKKPDGTWNLTTLMDGDGLGTGVVGAEQIMAGAITADLITLTSGGTLEDAVPTVWRDFPTPPYKERDIWLQPPLTISQVQAKGWTIAQVQAMGLTVADLAGGNAYVCRATRTSGTLNMSDWQLAATDGKDTSNLYSIVTDYKAQLDQQALRLSATDRQVTSAGDTIRATERRLTDVEAGKIQLSSQTLPIGGTWTPTSWATWTPDSLRFDHTDGSYSELSKDGLALSFRGLKTPYLGRVTVVPYNGNGYNPVRVEVPDLVKGRPYTCFVAGSDSGQAPSPDQQTYRAGRHYYGICPPARIPDGGPEANDERVWVLAYVQWIRPDNTITYDGLIPATGSIIFIA